MLKCLWEGWKRIAEEGLRRTVEWYRNAGDGIKG